MIPAAGGLPPGLAAALQQALAPSFVQRVHAGDDLLVLELRQPGRSAMLALSLAPSAAGAALLADEPALPTPAGALRSFRDHLRGALPGLRLQRVLRSPEGTYLALEFAGERPATLLLDASPRPNAALVQGAASHALRRPHEREGEPPAWLERCAPDPGPPLDLDAHAEALLALRDRVLARARLVAGGRELRAGLAAARRLVARRQDDVARLGDASEHRRLADALAASLHLVRRGQSRIVAASLDGGEPLALDLDPRLQPGENLRRRYAAAAKAERGERMARSQLQLATQRACALESCAQRAADVLAALGDGPLQESDLGHVRDVLEEAARLLPRAKQQDGRPAPTRPARAPALEGLREFVSHDGLRILAGRSATTNDQLTFRVARGNDVWLHARDAAGPHVVLSLPKGAEIPQESLLDAASVAHVLGRRGSEPRGEITWARAKDVRRAPGGIPGRVTIARERVMLLVVEPERLARLGLR